MDSNMMYISLAVVGLLLIVFLTGWLTRRRLGKLDSKKFRQRWNEVQALCASENTWPLAIINGDKLLDDALKKSRFKGKTMGERLVSAQRTLTDNDGVWFGHKLRNKLVHEEYDKLKKRDVKRVLMSFRQALRDLGVL